jgi:hypothetical protein
MALVESPAGSGNWNYESVSDVPGESDAKVVAFFEGLQAQTGVTYTAQDVKDLEAKLTGGSGYQAIAGGDPSAAYGEFTEQFIRRSGSGDEPDAPNVGSSVEDVRRYRSDPLASVITTQGATEDSNMTPTVGPVGLAYPDDPVNYATMQQSPSYGYTGGGGIQSGIYPTFGSAPVNAATGIPAATDNTMLYLVLAGAAVALYLLMK